MEKEIKEFLLYIFDIALGIASGMGFISVMENIYTIDGAFFGVITLIPFTILVIRVSKKALNVQKKLNVNKHV